MVPGVWEGTGLCTNHPRPRVWGGEGHSTQLVVPSRPRREELAWSASESQAARSGSLRESPGVFATLTGRSSQQQSQARLQPFATLPQQAAPEPQPGDPAPRGAARGERSSCSQQLGGGGAGRPRCCPGQSQASGPPPPQPGVDPRAAGENGAEPWRAVLRPHWCGSS